MAEQGYMLTEDALRRIGNAVRRVESESLGNPSARVKTPVSLQPQRFRLTQDLYRGATATANNLTWNSSFNQFAAGTGVFDILGDLVQGYHFKDRDVLAVNVNNSWYAITTGSYFARGTLDTSVSSGGSVVVSITEYSAGAWNATTRDVTALEQLGTPSPLALGLAVNISWDDLSLKWLITGAAC